MKIQCKFARFETMLYLCTRFQMWRPTTKPTPDIG